MPLTDEDKQEIKRMILFDRFEKESIMNLTQPYIDKSEIKIEIGSFGCFILGSFFTLIALGIWSWF